MQGDMKFSNSAEGAIKVSDDFREQRNLFLKKFHIIGIVYVVLSAILIGVGISMIAVGSLGEYGFPISNVGPLILGILMLAAGLLALEAYAKGQQFTESAECPRSVVNLIYGFNGLCGSCHGVSGWASAFSFMAVANCANESSNNHKYCIPGKDANIALAAIGGSLCVVFSFMCAGIGFMLYRYGRALGMRGCCGKS